MQKVFAFIFGICLLTACTGEELQYETASELVVEGWIEAGDFPVVILTRTLPVHDKELNLDELNDYLIRWAKVTIYDGQDSVVLTGIFDRGYYPPYIYTTGRMRGEVGKTYTLDVKYENYHATATTTIPARPQLDTLLVKPCEDNDTLFQIHITFTDNPSEINYYQALTRVGTSTKQYIASYLGCIDDTTIESPTNLSVYRGHQLNSENYTPYFSINDTVSVEFSQIDRESFLFWNDYIQSLTLAKNMFLATSTNIRSNITGGNGYWCGRGSTKRHIIIRDVVNKTRSYQ